MRRRSSGSAERSGKAASLCCQRFGQLFGCCTERATIASAERYYPYVRHARPHTGFQPPLVFPTAFYWDPEVQADLRCGLAAALLASASLVFLPYRISISFCPLTALRRPCCSLAVEHRFLVRMMSL